MAELFADLPQALQNSVEIARRCNLSVELGKSRLPDFPTPAGEPLEAFLADRSLDFPFCQMWANENWTRKWDGSDQEVLIAQDWHTHMAGAMGGDRAPVASWQHNLADAASKIESFLDSPPPAIGEPLEYDDPAFRDVL